MQISAMDRLLAPSPDPRYGNMFAEYLRHAVTLEVGQIEIVTYPNGWVFGVQRDYTGFETHVLHKSMSDTKEGASAILTTSELASVLVNGCRGMLEFQMKYTKEEVYV